MRRVMLSAGHSNKPGQDQGAVGNGLIEGVETILIRDRIAEYLRGWGLKVKTDPNESVTKTTVQLFNSLVYGSDIVVDIHINAASNPAATGAEVIVSDDYSLFESILADDLADAISKSLKIKNRGVKKEGSTPRKKLLWFTIPAETVLIECFFITNPNDIRMYKENFEEMCRSIAVVIYNFSTI